ncbi:hypothetical protein DFJ74DRAFT_654655 [Hyaloraphidium curvatum]|nr:hypothetical protein DFJ74DRAFT_654655 [Hyaloraphidium curvatum]
MDMFHEHFRRTWAYLHGACTAGSRPPGVSIREFLSAGLGFLENLEGHHDIEEYYVFPALARRIPEFSSAGVLTAQHGEIHAGMDRMKALLEACRKGERELRLSELKEVMDSFGPALMRHLDQEVRLLEPENLSRYYRVDELGLIPGLS